MAVAVAVAVVELAVAVAVTAVVVVVMMLMNFVMSKVFPRKEVEVQPKNAEKRRCPGQVREQIDAKVAEWREEGKAGLGLLGL